MEALDKRISDLQDQVVRRIKDNEKYNSLVDEITKLRNRRERLTNQQAVVTRNEERIRKLRESLLESEEETLAYSDKLVRDFIEKIEVLPDRLRVTIKSGMTTDVMA